MIEKTVLEYLNSRLDVMARMEKVHADRYVLIEKTGSSNDNFIYSTTLAIQSYAPSLYEAALLNEQVKEVMSELPLLNEVTRCELNTDYNYTNPATKQYRYQAVFNITHY